MGILKRIRRITTAKVESFLARAEDPEQMFPQLVTEMEEQVRSSTDAEAKAMAAVRSAERSLDEVKQRVSRLADGAENAIDAADDALAREAIEAQVALEKDQESREEALDRARRVYDEARQARLDIQSRLEELKGKRDEIITRSRVLKTQQKVQQSLAAPTASSGSILDAVAAMEGKLQEQEAEIEVRREAVSGGANASLERRLDGLEKDSEVEKRLEALKARMRGVEPKSK